MEAVEHILTHGVQKLIDPQRAFEKKLRTCPEKVVAKLGIDPTRPDIHIGHAVCLHKLRQLQDIGAKVVFIVGDFTGRIGDPTGKSKVRPELDQKEMEENVRTFVEQVGNILVVDDPARFAWIRNSDWFVDICDIHAPKGTIHITNEKDGKSVAIEHKENAVLAKAASWQATRMQQQFGKNIKHMSLINFLATLRHITHGQLIERDMFKERIQKNEPLFMHEMMYPVLQALDSVGIASCFGACDVELGGTDQHFNLLMGREVMQAHGLPPQAVMTMDILEGTDGTEKMSKSLDNYIGITESPTDMFGKTMRIPDSRIERWATLGADMPKEAIEALDIEKNPRSAKAEVAGAIVARYHGKEAAEKAAEEFDRVYAAGGLPDDIPTITVEEGSFTVVALMQSAGFATSSSEARRLIEGGAVSIAGEKIATVNATTDITPTPTLLSVGKRKHAYIQSI